MHLTGVGLLVALIVALLLLATAVLAFSKRVRLPYTVLLVAAGVVVGELAHAGVGFLHPVVEYAVSAEVILFVFLPTLIFESALNLDPRQLRDNLLPILTLAVPGLLLSTGIIGSLVALTTPVPLPAALLLGSILSATDPVAVISIFRQLGAPRRLTVLVEGESLLNDATAIVVSKILVGVMAAGYLGSETIWQGVGEFCLVFLGGALVGWGLAVVTGLLLGLVRGDPHIEITLTTVLAYLSFLLAEQVMQVSGVMATVAAGLTIGSWGRSKISHRVSAYLEHFWDYMAFAANSLIFLLVGLRVDMPALWRNLDMLAWVIAAMLLSRAVVVYAMVPLPGILGWGEKIDVRYQSVMFWGGLRGAIALAIVISLPDFDYTDRFIAVVTGAVLFTLLVQALSIEKLVSRLGLAVVPLADRLLREETGLLAVQSAESRLSELSAGGLFSATVAQRQKAACQEAAGRHHTALARLRRELEDTGQEYALLFNRCFNLEKAVFHQLYNNSHLSEQSFRDLMHLVDGEAEKMRHAGAEPSSEDLHRLTRLRRGLIQLSRRLPGRISDALQITQTARDYEEAWGRYLSSQRVLKQLDELAAVDSGSAAQVERVRGIYQTICDQACTLLDNTAEQFPEFVSAMQSRLASRLVLEEEIRVVRQRAESGVIPEAVGEALVDDYAEQLYDLRGLEIERIRLDPLALLRVVEIFRRVPDPVLRHVAGVLHQQTYSPGEQIINQGDQGDALYLIARGVVRVSRRSGNRETDLATLFAGDVIGEMALLTGEPRNANCRAVTPCALYQLRRSDLEELRVASAEVDQALRRMTEVRNRNPD